MIQILRGQCGNDKVSNHVLDYLAEQRHFISTGPGDYCEETFHILFFNFMHFLFTFNDAVYIHHPEILKESEKKY